LELAYVKQVLLKLAVPKDFLQGFEGKTAVSSP